VGSSNRGLGEYYDHEPRDPAAGLDPKKRTLGAAERNEERRAIWHRIVTKFDARHYVFLDESGANITLAPRYGWAPKGERCPGSVPRNYHENLTLFASLSLDGLTSAMLLDGAADRVAFEVYVREILVPTLTPGQIVILDNLAVHKQPALRRLIHAAGCRVLFLPSYSPDFNPIELAFAEIKAYLRRMAARTRVALEHEIGRAIDRVTAQHAVNYFRHCGYRSPAQ
jgi:transposase